MTGSACNFIASKYAAADSAVCPSKRIGKVVLRHSLQWSQIFSGCHHTALASVRRCSMTFRWESGNVRTIPFNPLVTHRPERSPVRVSVCKLRGVEYDHLAQGIHQGEET